MTKDRAQAAYDFRVEAAELARHRHPVKHEANGDEQKYATACYPMSFTKGLDHDYDSGLVARSSDFETFRMAIDNAYAEPFTTRVPVPRKFKGKECPRRKWEAPTAGVVFDLEGPDAQAVTMAPAPALCTDELTFEMAEVYELALVRDEPFNVFDSYGSTSAKLKSSIANLNHLQYAKDGFPGRPRKAAGDGKLDPQTVFRGSSPGVDAGPYISQFLLIGTGNDAGKGLIGYGAQTIDQRVVEAKKADDYMMKWDDWLKVQEGFDPRPKGNGGQAFTGATRFIHTPRDLATYVHIDQLYQAYLNACLILLGTGAPFDPSFDMLSGMGAGVIDGPSSQSYVNYNAGGFALWGGPHILSLVTEVATRGLKAVRYQKFNNHLRLRPEALAGRLEKAAKIDGDYPATCCAFTKMEGQLTKTLEEIREHNKAHKNGGQATALLPMAFAEGSPMHPTYGAGHATVAGACVTMLKAFFDTSAVFARLDGVAGFYNKDQIDDAKKVEYGAYESVDHGKAIKFKPYDTSCADPRKGKAKTKRAQKHCPLTLEGELNKLAANISIGRNMAGVHYFSDYFDSARMGEEIAIGILEEQALGYPTDDFVLSVPTFDGPVVRIGQK